MLITHAIPQPPREQNVQVGEDSAGNAIYNTATDRTRISTYDLYKIGPPFGGGTNFGAGASTSGQGWLLAFELDCASPVANINLILDTVPAITTITAWGVPVSPTAVTNTIFSYKFDAFLALQYSPSTYIYAATIADETAANIKVIQIYSTPHCPLHWIVCAPIIADIVPSLPLQAQLVVPRKARNYGTGQRAVVPLLSRPLLRAKLRHRGSQRDAAGTLAAVALARAQDYSSVAVWPGINDRAYGVDNPHEYRRPSYMANVTVTQTSGVGTERGSDLGGAAISLTLDESVVYEPTRRVILEEAI